jgi:hypothetical protein
MHISRRKQKDSVGCQKGISSGSDSEAGTIGADYRMLLVLNDGSHFMALEYKCQLDDRQARRLSQFATEVF